MKKRINEIKEQLENLYQKKETLQEEYYDKITGIEYEEEQLQDELDGLEMDLEHIKEDL